MKVVGKESPGIDNEIPIQAQISQSIQKIFPVLIRAKYIGPFNAPAHNVV
jgi:hypothetical protein